MTARDQQICDLIVMALCCAPPNGMPGWTMAALERAAQLKPDEVRGGVRKLRLAGKIDFKDLVLSPSMRAGSPCLPASEQQMSGDRAGTAELLAQSAIERAIDALPVNPTGADLVAVIRIAARARGVSAFMLHQPLSTNSGWLNVLQQAKAPKPATVARVKALVRGEPLPPRHNERARRRPNISQRTREFPETDGPDEDWIAAMRGEADAREQDRIERQRRVAAAEADLRGRNRRAARSVGTVVRGGGGNIDRTPLLEGLSAGDRIQAALIDEPAGAMAVARNAWPDLWTRIMKLAREASMRPGTAFQRALAAGLDCMEESA